MKKEGHPNYQRTVIACACGASYDTSSTKPNIQVEICSSCHPFYTGQQRVVDTEGRIEKFQRKYKRANNS